MGQFQLASHHCAVFCDALDMASGLVIVRAVDLFQRLQTILRLINRFSFIWRRIIISINRLNSAVNSKMTLTIFSVFLVKSGKEIRFFRAPVAYGSWRDGESE